MGFCKDFSVVKFVFGWEEPETNKVCEKLELDSGAMASPCVLNLALDPERRKLTAMKIHF